MLRQAELVDWVRVAAEPEEYAAVVAAVVCGLAQVELLQVASESGGLRQWRPTASEVGHANCKYGLTGRVAGYVETERGRDALDALVLVRR